MPGAAAYCATKAALNSFTIALRAELKVRILLAARPVDLSTLLTMPLPAQGTGVRVLSICPACITEGGAYDRHIKECASNGILRCAHDPTAALAFLNATSRCGGACRA